MKSDINVPAAEGGGLGIGAWIAAGLGSSVDEEEALFVAGEEVLGIDFFEI